MKNGMYILCLSKGLDAIGTWKNTANPTKPIAFIPNAGDTYKNPYFVDESRRRLEILGLTTRTIDLRHIRSGAEFEDLLSECAAVFVAGGNSYNLLDALHKSFAFDALRRSVLNGFPYFGESAGAVILYKTIEPVAMIDDPQDVPNLQTTDALGIVDFITLPHVNREKYATLFDRFYKQFSPAHKIIKITDEQAIFTTDGSHYQIVPSRIADLG